MDLKKLRKIQEVRRIQKVNTFFETLHVFLKRVQNLSYRHLVLKFLWPSWTRVLTTFWSLDQSWVTIFHQRSFPKLIPRWVKMLQNQLGSVRSISFLVGFSTMLTGNFCNPPKLCMNRFSGYSCGQDLLIS